MEEKNYTGAVPGQHEGDAITAETVKTCNSQAEAIELYGLAKSRLLDINHWHELAGEAMATFQLTDDHGSLLDGPATQGRLIRIDIPGPGGENAGGYDWVEIEEVQETGTGDVESIAVRVRPVAAPGSDDSEPTHFYDRNSTSTFTLTREGTKVTAAVYDRNIEANTEADSLLDKVRNAITGFIGKKVFSKIQWQLLTDGLLG